MAHNIEIRHGQASMFYVDEPPWHGLGQKLAKPATAKEAVEAAKLNWEVMKVPLYAEQANSRITVRDTFGIVRKDQWPSKDCKVLGIVGSQYTPLQNSEAFTFFDPIVGKKAAVYHTAGVLGSGERIWILAKLPDHIRVVGDDVVDKFLLLSNSHDGTSSVQMKFTPIRVVCQNTLTMALSEGRTIRVAHTRHLHCRPRQAESLMGIIHTRFQDIEETFTAMARVQMGNGRLQEYLKLVYPDPKDPEDERARKRVDISRARAEYLFAHGQGNRQRGVRGTLWSAYNGVTELVDHAKRPGRPMIAGSIQCGSAATIRPRPELSLSPRRKLRRGRTETHVRRTAVSARQSSRRDCAQRHRFPIMEQTMQFALTLEEGLSRSETRPQDDELKFSASLFVMSLEHETLNRVMCPQCGNHDWKVLMQMALSGLAFS